ncbi:hypothetical protein [Hahella ganghwensis]|uniref:hypothetical protein n=1 Tax=Hahella ganghwensis TaxID=286420 RepID=UPI0003815737|nr:hypothetical protein [Hahella ganghwensis]
MSPDDAPQGGKIQNGRKNTLNIRPYIVESLNYLRTLGLFRLSLDPFLIIDVDAHHGNGNAYTFLHDDQVTLLDVYNQDIYPLNPLNPLNPVSRERVNISVPLPSDTSGKDYLNQLELALSKLSPGPKIAFVVAGTDVLATDPLGGLRLTVEDVAAREQLIYQRLKELNISMVFLGGGGYGKESAQAIIESLKAFQGKK